MVEMLERWLLTDCVELASEMSDNLPVDHSASVCWAPNAT